MSLSWFCRCRINLDLERIHNFTLASPLKVPIWFDSSCIIIVVPKGYLHAVPLFVAQMWCMLIALTIFRESGACIHKKTTYVMILMDAHTNQFNHGHITSPKPKIHKVYRLYVYIVATKCTVCKPIQLSASDYHCMTTLHWPHTHLVAY